MTSYSARLRVAGHNFPIIHCTYGAAQATGSRGRIVGKVRHGSVRLELDVPDGDLLLA